MTRTDIPVAWDERTLLATFLDYTRATAVLKCAGLTDEQGRATPLATSPLMSPAGVLNHLRWVDQYWIEHVFLGGEDLGPWTDEEPEREFTIVRELPLAEVVRGYEEQSARLRGVVAGLDLDARASRPTDDGHDVDLRWILHHLVEETARHNGHLDILRELVDGTTGV
jgi:uncharacterized damage-inducible protein DinB